MYLVNKATKRPQRPSEFLGLNRFAGPIDCVDFDLAVEQFDDWIEARRAKREMIDAPQGDGKPKQAVPFYETVAQLLGREPSPYEDFEKFGTSEESFSADDAEILERLANGEIDDLADLHREKPQCQPGWDPSMDA